jgi:hypothetical protein
MFQAEYYSVICVTDLNLCIVLPFAPQIRNLWAVGSENRSRSCLSKLGDLLAEDKRSALITLSQFVLRREAGEIREDLYKNVVETAVFLGTKKTRLLSLPELERVLETQLYGVKLPGTVLKRTIDSLVADKRVEIGANDLLRVNDERKLQLEQDMQTQKLVAERVEEKLLDKVHAEYRLLTSNPLPSVEPRETLQVFYSFLSSLVRERGDFVAGILAGSEQVRLFQVPLDVLGTASLAIEDGDLRIATVRAIESIFRTAPPDLTRYVLIVCQNFICLKILNLDPLCQRLERELFAQQTMFLDTNLLIALTCDGDSYHALAVEMIKRAGDLEVSVVFSQRTADEFLRVLDNANHSYPGARVPWRLLERARDPFIASFAIEHNDNPSQTWDGYYLRNKQMEMIVTKRFGVKKYEIDSSIEKLPWYDDITRKVADCYLTIRGFPKALDVAAHDSFHMLLVKELRKGRKKRALGPDYWFVTLDRTLACADDEINRKGYSEKTSAVMECDVWMEMITPFLAVSANKDMIDAYSAVFQSQFTTIASGIVPEVLQWVQGEWLTYSWLTTDDIEAVLHDRFVEDLSKKVSEAHRTGRDEQIAMDELRKRVESRLGSVFERKMAEMERGSDAKIEDLKRKNEERINRLQTDLARERNLRDFFRVVAGILGAILIVADVVLFITTPAPSLQTTTICIFFLAAGAVLLLMAIAYEQVEALIHLGPSK